MLTLQARNNELENENAQLRAQLAGGQSVVACSNEELEFYIRRVRYCCIYLAGEGGCFGCLSSVLTLQTFQVAVLEQELAVARQSV